MKVRCAKNLLPLILTYVLIVGRSSILIAADKDEVGLRFGISFPEERSQEPLDGRMLLIISTDGESQPRFQISDGPRTQIILEVLSGHPAHS